MPHVFYSQRIGSNPNRDGLPLDEILQLFVRTYESLHLDGYFHQAFGFSCVDMGDVDGAVRDVPLAILLSLRKKGLWPICDRASGYSEDDLFDMIEFLFQHVSKPVSGHMHSYNNCGMHWETFNRRDGQIHFCEQINTVLSHYRGRFELSEKGEVLQRPEVGFEQLIEADLPTAEAGITSRVEAAVTKYRRHGATIDDRRQAVRDLADVLEFLRPRMKEALTSADEGDLFNIANNFGIRHHNDRQKTGYDAALWLSWMFYYYLATIHVIVRKLS